MQVLALIPPVDLLEPASTPWSACITQLEGPCLIKLEALLNSYDG